MSRERPVIVVTDTSVLVNFLCIDRMALIAAHSHDFIVTDHVAGEITASYPDQLARFELAVAERSVTQCSLIDPNELTLFGILESSGRLGLGECSAIALAVYQGHMLAIDDKRAAQEARRRHARLRILRTQDLIVSMIKERLLSVAKADVIKAEWEKNHRFRLKISSFSELL